MMHCACMNLSKLWILMQNDSTHMEQLGMKGAHLAGFEQATSL